MTTRKNWIRKLLAVLIGVLFLGVALIYGITCGNYKTIAELCGVDASDKIVSIEFILPSRSPVFRDSYTTYSEGSVYEQFSAVLYIARFSGEKLPGNLTTGIYDCLKIVYCMEDGRQIALIVLPPEYPDRYYEWYLITDLYDLEKRKEYGFKADLRISYDELERLARAGNE